MSCANENQSKINLPFERKSTKITVAGIEVQTTNQYAKLVIIIILQKDYHQIVVKPNINLYRKDNKIQISSQCCYETYYEVR
jgi:hypothetical protein